MKSLRGNTSDSSGDKKSGLGCAIAFFAIFGAFGLAFLLAFFVPPVIKSIGARDWKPVPCTILASEVKSKTDSDGSTYKIYVSYNYEYAGQSYTGDRYEFMDGWTSGRSRKERTVSRYPEGSKSICYVDPDDPSQSVIERGLTVGLWFALIPGVFVLIGAGGIVGTVIAHRRQLGPRRSNIKSWLPTKAITDAPQRLTRVPLFQSNRPASMITLRSTGSLAPKLMFLLFFTVFWNGVVAFMVTKVIHDFGGGAFDVCFGLFSIPFVVVGIVLFGVLIHTFLGVFNPRVTLRIGAQMLQLGESTPVEWEFTGRTDRIQHLRIWLEGREETTYRRGTTSYTDKAIFFSQNIAEASRDFEIRMGKGQITVPSDTMHSLDGKSNKIIWQICLNGDIPRWPDVEERFDLAVVPPGTRK